MTLSKKILLAAMFAVAATGSAYALDYTETPYVATRENGQEEFVDAGDGYLTGREVSEREFVIEKNDNISGSDGQ